MQLPTRFLITTGAALVASCALANAMPSYIRRATSSLTTKSDTCDIAESSVVFDATLSAKEFDVSKCNTCIYVPPAVTGGYGIVARVTGVCSTCTSGQAKLTKEAVNAINGRSSTPSFPPKPPLPLTVTSQKTWDCDKPAPPVKSPSPGSISS
ncbi:hypothetical protein BDF19DRAFT_430745 [Syncephalis fuscata]|nr:hypothetical protein BDF19DRAFT_430745 [Syncephalis fuscata]